jgi:hypothetical protein
MTFGLLDFIENLKLWKRTFHHAQRRVAKPVHNPVAQRTVVDADTHRPAQLFAPLHQRDKLLF